jgi:hypothetical protein
MLVELDKVREIIIKNQNCSAAFSGNGGCGNYTPCNQCTEYKTLHKQLDELDKLEAEGK